MTDRKESVEQREAGVSASEVRANLLKWIEDLETTDAKQARGGLRGDKYKDGPVSPESGYCCLARLSVALRRPELVGSDEFGEVADVMAAYRLVRTGVGLTPNEEERCIRMNDEEGYTFREIAAWLRQNVLPRYPQ